MNELFATTKISKLLSRASDLTWEAGIPILRLELSLRKSDGWGPRFPIEAHCLRRGWNPGCDGASHFHSGVRRDRGL